MAWFKSPFNPMKPMHPPYAARLWGSISAINCIALTLGAPLSVPAGKVSIKALTGVLPAFIRPVTRDTR